MKAHERRYHAQRNFLLQQGLPKPRPVTCIDQFSALMFATAVLLQLPWPSAC